MISDELRNELNAAAVEVFGTMYFTPVELLSDLPDTSKMRQDEGYIKSAIGYDGPQRAALSFYFPRTLGVSIASGFLGMGEDQVTDQQLVDTMQESANMIVGNFLGRIDPKGACALGIPSAELVKGFFPDSVCAQGDELLAFVSDFGFLWLVFSAQ